MTINTFFTIVLIIVTVAVLVGGIYLYLRDKNMNEIRAEVYQKFLEAEHNPEFINASKQRMKWVLSQARGLLPTWLHLFITDAFLEKTVEGWFKAIKDLLDDGKLNKSQKKEG